MGHFTQVSFFKRGCQPSCAVGARQRSLTQWAGEVEVIGFQPSLQQHRVALGVVSIGISSRYPCMTSSSYLSLTRWFQHISTSERSHRHLCQTNSDQLWVRSPMNHGISWLSHPNICGWWTHRIPMPLWVRYRWQWEDLSVPTGHSWSVANSRREFGSELHDTRIQVIPYDPMSVDADSTTLTQNEENKKNTRLMVWKFWSKPIWW